MTATDARDMATAEAIWQRGLEFPNGCQHCGLPAPHGWQWLKGIGLHQWVPPTDAQILARMKARRIKP